jgi:DNA-binding protein HU-beta
LTAPIVGVSIHPVFRSAPLHTPLARALDAAIALSATRHTDEQEDTMTTEARKMGKSELFSHFAERFDIKRTQAREFFEELGVLCERELKRSGEFVIPGVAKLVLQKRAARVGRNPATGEPIEIAAKTVVKARVVKQLKDTVLPKN